MKAKKGRGGKGAALAKAKTPPMGRKDVKSVSKKREEEAAAKQAKEQQEQQEIEDEKKRLELEE